MENFGNAPFGILHAELAEDVETDSGRGRGRQRHRRNVGKLLFQDAQPLVIGPMGQDKISTQCSLS